MPFTATQAIDITAEPRVTVGAMNYRYKEDYTKSDDVTWQDTVPFLGGGVLFSTTGVLSFCERIFLDLYGQRTDKGRDSDAQLDSPGVEPMDDNIDFSRRDYVGTVGCEIPLFGNLSMTATGGVKASETELNGVHRRYPLGRPIRISPEDSTTLDTLGGSVGSSVAWQLNPTSYLAVNLAYTWLWKSDYVNNYNPTATTSGDSQGWTWGMSFQNTLTRHLTWKISADYFSYEMTTKGSSTLSTVEERIIPVRFSVTWRF